MFSTLLVGSGHATIKLTCRHTYFDVKVSSDRFWRAERKTFDSWLCQCHTICISVGRLRFRVLPSCETATPVWFCRSYSRPGKRTVVKINRSYIVNACNGISSIFSYLRKKMYVNRRGNRHFKRKYHFILFTFICTNKPKYELHYFVFSLNNQTVPLLIWNYNAILEFKNKIDTHTMNNHTNRTSKTHID